MPQTRIDWKRYDEWSGTDADFARRLGMSPNNFSQYKRRHLRTKPTAVRTKLPTSEDVPVEPVELVPTSNGNLPAIPSSQPIAVPSPYIAVPSPSIATELDDLRSRLSTVEAFIAAMQADHRSVSQPIAIVSPPIAVHRREPQTWLSRGLQVAADMAEWLDTYAEQNRLQKREILDTALRTFKAMVEGQEVGDDA